MKYLLSAVAVAFCLLPTSRAADEDNPFKKAKVGDFTEYKSTISAMGKPFQATMKMVVIAKNDKEATIEITTKASLMGKDLPPQTQTQKIDLTKPYDQTASANLPKGTDVKIEKGQTTEKIKAGGKEYECTWMKAKSTFKSGELTTESDMKIWISKDVPLSGMVKMEVKSQFANLTLELSSAGRK